MPLQVEEQKAALQKDIKEHLVLAVELRIEWFKVPEVAKGCFFAGKYSTSRELSFETPGGLIEFKGHVTKIAQCDCNCI